MEDLSDDWIQQELGKRPYISFSKHILTSSPAAKVIPRDEFVAVTFGYPDCLVVFDDNCNSSCTLIKQYTAKVNFNCKLLTGHTFEKRYAPLLREFQERFPFRKVPVNIVIVTDYWSHEQIPYFVKKDELDKFFNFSVDVEFASKDIVVKKMRVYHRIMSSPSKFPRHSQILQDLRSAYARQ